jgi:hypothetical protein
MLNGQYRAITNRIALNQLNVPVFIPNPNLAIESGEERQPFGLSLTRYAPKTPAVVLPNPLTLPIEQATTEHIGNPVKQEDFMTDEFWLGSPF